MPKKILIVLIAVLLALLIQRVVISPEIEKTSVPEVVVTGGKIPIFSHIVVIVLENREFKDVYGSENMPYFNGMAENYTLLDQYYGIRHPSLPNYLALVGGDTFGITEDCTSCSVHASSFADLIENKGLTWKSYLESMPYACFLNDNSGNYAKRHNPFLYFDNIRHDLNRCRSSIVPLDELTTDLEQNNLPNFSLITPNVCNDGHDCPENSVDLWLSTWIPKLQQYPDMQRNGMIAVIYDEGDSNQGCCEMTNGGGRTAAVIISSLAKSGFVDHTPYTHYSLLKTILTAWSLPYLNHAADPSTNIILAPWK
jgi:phosphatidylinositol-3-phosphatase